MVAEYIDFQFNGHYSKDLGLLRVTVGDRYNEPLTAEFEDRTIRKVGGHGSYYWESFYSTKSTQIDFAFDSLLEEDVRKLRQVFNGEAVGPLILSETPYKAQLVKLQSPVILSYLVFDVDGKRVYKGNGSLQFISYEPFSKSVHKYLDDYPEDGWGKFKEEWNKSAGLKRNKADTGDPRIDYDTLSQPSVLIYNAGDMPIDFLLYVDFDETGRHENLKITLKRKGASVDLAVLVLKDVLKKGNDIGIRINSSSNLIEGYDSNKELTGTLYNEFIQTGDFFKIPLDESVISVGAGKQIRDIKYEYLYY